MSGKSDRMFLIRDAFHLRRLAGILGNSPAGDVLSVSGNSGNAGDSGFAEEMESALGYTPCEYLC